jgi:hypothetical protein
VASQQALNLASVRLHFTVRVPLSWPTGSRLRALWVMDRHAPPFVVIYYGGNDGYITCQLRESIAPTRASLSWAPRTAALVGGIQGTRLETAIGGAYPVVELMWRSRGVYFDLLGSTSTPSNLLMTMATSLL